MKGKINYKKEEQKTGMFGRPLNNKTIEGMERAIKLASRNKHGAPITQHDVWMAAELDKGNPMPKEGTCCLCGEKFRHYGNNPFPLCDYDDYDSRCCDKCNDTKVMIGRLLIGATESEIRDSAADYLTPEEIEILVKANDRCASSEGEQNES